jgi:S-formylglutathione hydrolase FrmB
MPGLSFRLVNRTSTLLPLLVAPFLGLACSSSPASDNPPPSSDDASADAGDASTDAPSYPDVPEPPWSGQTIEPGCTADGCIHAFTMGASYPQSVLSLAVATGNTVENGIVLYGITYVSDGAEITGTVAVPDSPPPAGGYGVVVMNQFTSGVAPACAPSKGELAIGVASAGALHGFVTIVPDATSYGPQPYSAYMVGKVAGRAALDAARAAFHTTQALGVPIARKAVIAGLSEGAHSTMAAAAQFLQYSPHLEIRGFAAAEPPSHMATALQASAQADSVNIVFDALRLWSWQHFLGLSGGGIFRAPYDTEAPQWFENDCEYDGASGSTGMLYTQFPNSVSTVLSDEFLGYAKNDAWPADWAAQNTASEEVPAGIKQPILIYEGTADTTVLPANTQAYVDELKAAGVAVDYRIEQGGTHGTTALSSFTVQQVAGADAVAWIKQQLAN